MEAPYKEDTHSCRHYKSIQVKIIVEQNCTTEKEKENDIFVACFDKNVNFLDVRLLILVRLIALVFYLRWRVTHPNEDARWLRGMSVVCEIWFAFSWLSIKSPRFVR